MRRLLVLAAASGSLALAGCGFTPLYAQPGVVSNLAAIDVVAPQGRTGFLDGLDIETAKALAIARIEELGQGEGATVYRLRDWGVARQRAWGCPIPMVHCETDGVVPPTAAGNPRKG